MDKERLREGLDCLIRNVPSRLSEHGEMKHIISVLYCLIKESDGPRIMTRAEFDEQVDFLARALDRKDRELLTRRLKYIFDRHGFIIEE